MDRHDTHLLSQESGVKEKEEDAHQFNFNDPIYLSYDSEDKLVSKETVNNSPLHLNYIEQNNIEDNNINNKSIISSQEIRDIFHGQENNTKINKKKEKPKKNKYFIKLRKIKLNNDDSNEIVENCLTYFPTLRNDIIDKKINKLIDKNRNCISLNNKSKNNKKRNKLKNHRKLNSLNEKEFLYFFYNDDNKGNKENIGAKAKSKYPLINTKNKSNNNKANTKDNDKSNKLKKNNKDNNNYRKIYNLNSNKNKPQLILNKNNNNNRSKSSKNKKFLVNTNYSNKNTSKSKIRKSSNQSTSLISTKNKEKVGMLYNQLYGKKKHRVKSTESLFENKPNRNWQYINDYKDQTFLKVYKKNKKENRIKTKKIFCSQNGSIINHFSRHFGNCKNCPVCQANKSKQDESIREKGICPMIPNIGDDDSQSRLQNRRVYSALSRVLSKMNRNHNEFDFLKNNLNGSKNRNRSKINGFNYGNKIFKNYFNGANNKNNLKRSESAVVRKVNVDRTLFKENNSSINNQINIYKNQSVKN